MTSSRDRKKEKKRRRHDDDEDREKDRDKDRDKDREKDSHRDKRREERGDRDERRDKDEDRSSRRPRSRSREKSPDRRRERSRDRRERGDGERGRREREDSKYAPSRRAEERPAEEDSVKKVTLADILRDNPGITMSDAIQRLHAINIASMAGDHASETALARSYTVISSINASTGLMGVGGSATKSIREVYVGNLPPGVSIPQLIEFFNAGMKLLGATNPRGCVVSAWISSDGHYAFVELSTVEECNACMTFLNGFPVGSVQLKIGRPSGFRPVPGMNTSIGEFRLSGGSGLSTLGGILGASGAGAFLGGIGSVYNPHNMSAANAGIVGMGGENKPEYENVIMLLNIPSVLDKDSLKEIISPFGEICAFNIIPDPQGDSQSIVFKLVDDSVTKEVVDALGSLILGDKKLVAQIVPANMVAVLLPPPSTDPALDDFRPPPPPPKETKESKEMAMCAKLPPSVVLRFTGMTVEEDLTDDECFDEMMEDIASECNVHGFVKTITIPRENDNSGGRGFVFVQFTSIEGAVKCKAACDDRTFNGNEIQITFYPESLLAEKVYVVSEDFSVAKAAPKEDLD